MHGFNYLLLITYINRSSEESKNLVSIPNIYDTFYSLLSEQIKKFPMNLFNSHRDFVLNTKQEVLYLSTPIDRCFPHTATKIWDVDQANGN